MTTITKERLLTIKQWRETYGPGSNVVLPAEEAEELARIALASLEAEPIGFRCRRNDNLGDWSYVYHREPDDFERKHLVIEGIYAAPPAPVVPEEKPMPNPLSMYAVDAVAAIAEVRGWNACRAAMLQAGNFRENKDSSTNNFRETSETSTNSPVIPDGWISCSERIPAQDDWVLIYSKHGEYMAGQVQGEYVELSDGTLSWLGNALYWMLLPEPPQEVRQ
ncbi:DUF551 domain-containing protein [Escherichia coli]|nr:DUF551 domain-containing protein [Escherichia coli]EHN2795617.1 DUF551 domain-containing protein [Escherichia coli]EKM7156799.1 DUF551 domain-containing protein [Escherichia coli]ELW1136484.1 DUF551 domain-containing protein [Escherichia coli]